MRRKWQYVPAKVDTLKVGDLVKIVCWSTKIKSYCAQAGIVLKHYTVETTGYRMYSWEIWASGKGGRVFVNDKNLSRVSLVSYKEN